MKKFFTFTLLLCILLCPVFSVDLTIDDVDIVRDENGVFCFDLNLIDSDANHYFISVCPKNTYREVVFLLFKKLDSLPYSSSYTINYLVKGESLATIQEYGFVVDDYLLEDNSDSYTLYVQSPEATYALDLLENLLDDGLLAFGISTSDQSDQYFWHLNDDASTLKAAYNLFLFYRFNFFGSLLL